MEEYFIEELKEEYLKEKGQIFSWKLFFILLAYFFICFVLQSKNVDEMIDFLFFPILIAFIFAITDKYFKWIDIVGLIFINFLTFIPIIILEINDFRYFNLLYLVRSFILYPTLFQLHKKFVYRKKLIGVGEEKWLISLKNKKLSTEITNNRKNANTLKKNYKIIEKSIIFPLNKIDLSKDKKIPLEIFSYEREKMLLLKEIKRNIAVIFNHNMFYINKIYDANRFEKISLYYGNSKSKKKLTLMKSREFIPSIYAYHKNGFISHQYKWDYEKELVSFTLYNNSGEELERNEFKYKNLIFINGKSGRNFFIPYDLLMFYSLIGTEDIMDIFDENE
ncbi:hypothetical protein [Fusobacterium sp. PH5-44]|uniref:hypothetical protein n=1 Tax=unclassified Fusobacterium TaxID=2648384 RepID=UPI003D20FD0D